MSSRNRRAGSVGCDYDYRRKIEMKRQKRRSHLFEEAIALVVAVILVCAIGKGNLVKSTDDVQKPESGVTIDFFADSLLIGDSRAETLGLYSDESSLDMYASKTINVETVMNSRIARDSNGQSCTVLEALRGKSYKSIYLGFGLEELNWYKDVYIKSYRNFLDNLTEVQPDARIYVMSILPVSADLSSKDAVYNNADIDTVNRLMQEMCDLYGNVTYLDVNGYVAVDGVLPEDAGIDGIHLNKKYCRKIIEGIRGDGYATE